MVGFQYRFLTINTLLGPFDWKNTMPLFRFLNEQKPPKVFRSKLDDRLR